MEDFPIMDLPSEMVSKILEQCDIRTFMNVYKSSSQMAHFIKSRGILGTVTAEEGELWLTANPAQPIAIQIYRGNISSSDPVLESVTFDVISMNTEGENLQKKLKMFGRKCRKLCVVGGRIVKEEMALYISQLANLRHLAISGSYERWDPTELVYSGIRIVSFNWRLIQNPLSVANLRCETIFTYLGFSYEATDVVVVKNVMQQWLSGAEIGKATKISFVNRSEAEIPTLIRNCIMEETEKACEHQETPDGRWSFSRGTAPHVAFVTFCSTKVIIDFA